MGNDRIIWKFCVIALLVMFFAGCAFTGSENTRVKALVSQLQGRSCSYELQKGVCVARSPFAFLLRRNDKEMCIVDAAHALGMMGVRARPAVPALIAALTTYHNVDSGDGIFPLRSEVALALGRIGDPAAIKPLLAIFGTNDLVTLSESAAVPAGYKLFEGSSYEAVIEALGMFGPQAKEALPTLNYLKMTARDPRAYLLSTVEIAIEKISR